MFNQILKVLGRTLEQNQFTIICCKMAGSDTVFPNAKNKGGV